MGDKGRKKCTLENRVLSETSCQYFFELSEYIEFTEVFQHHKFISLSF